ncbi:MAG: hypothetical protein ABI318_13935 [Chthoniobacteraceae bacterium]
MNTKLMFRIAAFVLRTIVTLATTPCAAAQPQAGASPAAQGHAVSGSGTVAPARRVASAPLPAALRPHFQWLAARTDAAHAAALWSDLLRLQSAGYPVSWLDECANSLEKGVLLAGTPATMLLDYWGEPLSRLGDWIRGQWTQVWTSRAPDGTTILAVIVNDSVS